VVAVEVAAILLRRLAVRVVVARRELLLEIIVLLEQ
jgi:hypothetical protein